MRISSFLVVAVFLFSLEAPASEILGAWHPERYRLADGTELPVTGLIFFTESDWNVLFFVEDEEGAPRRGSSEGGTYTLEGERLVFRHLYHLSVGEAVASLEEEPLRMSVSTPEEAVEEPCRVEVAGRVMTIHFPSGNHMEFEKSSGFQALPR